MFKYKIIEDSGCTINLTAIFVSSFVTYKNNARFVIFFFCRWNFSVGNHQIEMLPGDKKPHEAKPHEDEDFCSQTCPSEYRVYTEIAQNDIHLVF